MSVHKKNIDGKSRDRQLQNIECFARKYNGISFNHLSIMLELLQRNDEESYSKFMIALAVTLSPLKDKLEQHVLMQCKSDVAISSLNTEIAKHYLEYNDIDTHISSEFLALGLQMMQDFCIEEYIDLVSHFDTPHKKSSFKSDDAVQTSIVSTYIEDHRVVEVDDVDM